MSQDRRRGSEVGVPAMLLALTTSFVLLMGRGDPVAAAAARDSGVRDSGVTASTTIPTWTAESGQAGAWFGHSVATAGDVNGDGYADVIVDAPFYSNDQTDEGRAFVYLGSPSGLATNPAWTAEGDQAEARFGIRVATAGDVNGDGFDDVVVGVARYNNGQANVGRALVYLGSASGLATSPAWTAESDQADSEFGNSVFSAGDVNDDGYDDVIVGAHAYDNGETDEGRAFVYLGSASGLAPSPAWTAESDQVNALFGHWVATAGDVNDDGYDDVIVGAYLYDNGETDEGRAFVYLGSASGLTPSPAWTAESDQAGAFFGYPVNTAGDVNGDGHADVIVGAYRYDNDQSDEGRAFVYLGSASGLAPSPAWMAESDQAGAWFGHSVAAARDVNGDSYADVIVGAYRYDNDQTDEGRAFIYLGSASGLAPGPTWTSESDQADAGFGVVVDTAGDVNGDGYADVIVGAYLYDNGQTDEGRAFVYHGSVGCPVVPVPELCNGLDDDCDGLVDEIFDQDGDGITDCQGDCNDDDPDVHPGAAESCNGIDDDCNGLIDEGNPGGGGPCATGLAGVCAAGSRVCAAGVLVCEGPAPGAEVCNGLDDNCNGIVDELFDIDGDGVADCVDNCPTAYNPDQEDTDQDGIGDACDCFPVNEGAKLTASDPGVPAPDRAWGESVSLSGDTAIVGARYDDHACPMDPNCDSGSAYIFVRSSGVWLEQAKLIAMDESAVDGFGGSVAIDGDTAVVGAPFDHAGAFWAGSVYVFVRSGGVWTQEQKLTPMTPALDAEFGESVFLSGETLVVGAAPHALGTNSPGSAYVFRYRSDFPVGSRWVEEQKLMPSDSAPFDLFGFSIAVSGDTVVVGAQGTDDVCPMDPECYSGSAYVFVKPVGGWSTAPSPMNETAKLIASDAAAGDTFGHSVSVSGDTVMVGADRNDDAGYNSGSVYVFVKPVGGWSTAPFPMNESDKLTAPDAAAGDAFGVSVSVEGDTTVIGAAQPGYVLPAGAGAAYVFARSGGVWTHQYKLTASDAAASDGFGASVSLGGTTVVVGAPGDDHAGGISAGSAYVFDGFGCSDTDGDGYGVPGNCQCPGGTTPDCNDSDPEVYPGHVEVCDGKDNDCDGIVDNGPPESCNGIDDDCNGLIDEGNPWSGAPCDTGLLGVCALGSFTCSDGDLACQGPGPSAELCNGLDDNCNGLIDEPSDVDGDGVPDCVENCPTAYNPGQEDTDGDGIGDACDCDLEDPRNSPPLPVGNFLELSHTAGATTLDWSDDPLGGPFRVYRGWLNPGGSWAYNHYCAGEAISASSWSEPLSRNPYTLFYYLVTRMECSESVPGENSASVPIPNADPCPSAGTDADGDGTEQAIDNCPDFQNSEQSDVDADGHGDPCDNCPASLNPYQEDLDRDGLGDACDPDVDGDSILDDGDASGTAGDGPCTAGATMACDDNCPRTVNPPQADGDGDGIGDPCDNCPVDSNPGQADSDFDGIGDVCDPT